MKEESEIKAQVLLDRERHERRLDWVCVGIVLTLVSLSFYIVLKLMNNAEQTDSESLMWAKTFLTTIGGVAVGVLMRSGPVKKREK